MIAAVAVEIQIFDSQLFVIQVLLLLPLKFRVPDERR